MYFNPMYFVYALPGLALALWAQWKVKSTFAKYAQVPTQRNVNGLNAAQWIMGTPAFRSGSSRFPAN